MGINEFCISREEGVAISLWDLVDKAIPLDCNKSVVQVGNQIIFQRYVANL